MGEFIRITTEEAPRQATDGDPSGAMREPRAVCAACQTTETHWLEPVCDGCRTALEASGILKPKDRRTQIGPLDV